MADAPVSALRGTLVSFTDDPFLVDPAQAILHDVAGALVHAREPVDA